MVTYAVPKPELIYYTSLYITYVFCVHRGRQVDNNGYAEYMNALTSHIIGMCVLGGVLQISAYMQYVTLATGDVLASGLCSF
jgi:hypothetical protein